MSQFKIFILNVYFTKVIAGIVFLYIFDHEMRPLVPYVHSRIAVNIDFSGVKGRRRSVSSNFMPCDDFASQILNVTFKDDCSVNFFHDSLWCRKKFGKFVGVGNRCFSATTASSPWIAGFRKSNNSQNNNNICNEN